MSYPLYDLFDCWHEAFSTIRGTLFGLAEAEGLDQTCVVHMGGARFYGLLYLDGSDADFEDVAVSVGCRLAAKQFEIFFECDFGQGQPSFYAPSLFLDLLPDPRVLCGLLSSFFGSSLGVLRSTDSWRSALQLGISPM